MEGFSSGNKVEQIRAIASKSPKLSHFLFFGMKHAYLTSVCGAIAGCHREELFRATPVPVRVCTICIKAFASQKRMDNRLTADCHAPEGARNDRFLRGYVIFALISSKTWLKRLINFRLYA